MVSIRKTFAQFLRNETQNVSFFAHQFCAKKQQFAQSFAKVISRKIDQFHFCETFAKNISGFAQIAQKNSAKPRKTHCVSCAKIAQKFTKKKFGAKIAQILKRFSHFVETLAVTSVFCLHYRPETVHCGTKNAHTSEITFLAF